MGAQHRSNARGFALYTCAFCYEEPFKVLFDAALPQLAADRGLDLLNLLRKFFGTAKLRFYMTECTAALLAGKADTARCVPAAETLRCAHSKSEKCCEQRCLKFTANKGNPRQFIFFIANNYVINVLKKLKLVPILALTNNKLKLLPHSPGTLNKKARLERRKLETSAEDESRSDAPSA